VALQQSVDRFRCDPDTRLAGVDVHKKAENPPTLRGACWKSVQVKQIVARGQPERSGCFLFGAQGGSIQSPFARVVRQQSGEPRSRSPRKAREEMAESLFLVGTASSKSADPTCLGVEADVLVSEMEKSPGQALLK